MIRPLALVAAAASLAACEQAAGRCKPPAEARAAAAPPAAGALPSDRQMARIASDEARTCIQRQAWRLRRAKEETAVLAQAAVTACDVFVAAATEAEAGGPNVRDLNAAHDANIAAMTRWATLHLVQYRAGACE
ncbi:MAG: hypothetical protein ACOY4K_05220 [Pseudomonadota bacterium]